MSEHAVWSVTGLNEYVSAMLAGDERLASLRVRGEISGFKRHSSGHLYFSIKDDNALVRCVMFRQQAVHLRFEPKDGMLVTLTGSASLYTRDGAFQLYARAMEPCGDGMLYQKFLELKDRLEKAGYFDESRKRTVPLLPHCVGVATSDTGAALQDILQIIGRRFPDMPVIICPCAVQGAGAGEEIARAVERINADGRADVLIVGRGGGSLEDLWAFNEPRVAEAIYHSRIPVISAVGHETDYSIADFVADLRAPTPSAAAELAVPEYEACTAALSAYAARLSKALRHSLDARRSRVAYLMRSRAFMLVEARMAEKRQLVDDHYEAMREALDKRMQATRARLTELRGILSAVNPKAVLQRGYALLSDSQGATITSVSQLEPGCEIDIHMHDGKARATIIRAAGKES